MTTGAWTVRLMWLVWVALIGVSIQRLVEYGALQISPAFAYSLLALSVGVVLTAFRDLRTAVATGPSLERVASFLVAGSVSVSVLLALGLRFIGSGTEAPPAFITNVLDSTQFDSVLAYARRIPYDTGYHGTADSAMLTDSVGGIHPPVKAWVYPAHGANFVSYRSLSGMGRSRGRVLAKIRMDTAGYALLGLPAGVSYIWVDSLSLSRDTTGYFRAVLIPDKAGGRVFRFPHLATFMYWRSRGAFANYPMSRWVLQHSNCVNTSCSSGCCRVCPKN